MSVSRDFLRRIFSNKLSQSKLDLLYTLSTELDLVVSTEFTKFEFQKFNEALQATAKEAAFENRVEAWTQLEKLENIWKLRRKKYIPKDNDLLPECLTFNF